MEECELPVMILTASYELAVSLFNVFHAGLCKFTLVEAAPSRPPPLAVAIKFIKGSQSGFTLTVN